MPGKLKSTQFEETRHGRGTDGRFGPAENEGREDNSRSGRGVTLVETMLAALILMIVASGLLPLFTTAITQTERQGDVATRTTEYAQDKMEQLMKLDFNDGTTNTAVFPANPTGCTGTGTNICGLGGIMAAGSTQGSVLLGG